jgi:hypothetical protein
MIEHKYPAEFLVLVKHGGLVDDWANVYKHCKREGEIATVLSSLLGLKEGATEILVKSAILHDWFKRKERDMAASNPLAYEEAEKHSIEGLKALGYSDHIIDVAHSVGSFSLKEIQITNSILKRAMHWIDDVTHGDELVELDYRIDLLESAERYKELNQTGIAIYGKTLFQMQREIGHEIQEELELLCGVKKGSLVSEIKSRL